MGCGLFAREINFFIVVEDTTLFRWAMEWEAAWIFRTAKVRPLWVMCCTTFASSAAAGTRRNNIAPKVAARHPAVSPLILFSNGVFKTWFRRIQGTKKKMVDYTNWWRIDIKPRGPLYGTRCVSFSKKRENSNEFWFGTGRSSRFGMGARKTKFTLVYAPNLIHNSLAKYFSAVRRRIGGGRVRFDMAGRMFDFVLVTSAGDNHLLALYWRLNGPACPNKNHIRNVWKWSAGQHP